MFTLCTHFFGCNYDLLSARLTKLLNTISAKVGFQIISPFCNRCYNGVIQVPHHKRKQILGTISHHIYIPASLRIWLKLGSLHLAFPSLICYVGENLWTDSPPDNWWLDFRPRRRTWTRNMESLPDESRMVSWGHARRREESCSATWPHYPNIRMSLILHEIPRSSSYYQRLRFVRSPFLLSIPILTQTGACEKI